MAKLILVPTPVGNLKDITLRALEVLKEADLIAAEDTRQTSKLLKHYGIETPMTSFHMHNEHQKVGQLIHRIQQEGITVAVVTDAGSPGISDPGFLAVREAVKEGVEVESLPGATAFVPALVCSGLPCDRFVFEGFLPQKKGRQTRLKSLVEEERTMVFYESPHRLGKALKEMAEHFGADRMASVGREISKIHEEHRRGSLAELAEFYGDAGAKGEIVMVVAGKPKPVKGE